MQSMRYFLVALLSIRLIRLSTIHLPNNRPKRLNINLPGKMQLLYVIKSFDLPRLIIFIRHMRLSKISLRGFRLVRLPPAIHQV